MTQVKERLCTTCWEPFTLRDPRAGNRSHCYECRPEGIYKTVGIARRLALRGRVLRRHVAFRPRRCRRCKAPVLLDFDDRVLDARGAREHRHEVR